MSRLTAVHLLDDFNLGGITKSLGTFDEIELSGLVDSRVVAVQPGWRIAPRFDADIIVTHFPPSWRTLPFFLSLRRTNPHARFIHVEHSYTRAWEGLMVARPARFRRMLRLALAQPHDLVAVSHGQADWLAEASGHDRSRLRVIWPWSGSQQLDQLPLPVRDDAAPLVLGAYGRFAYAKGFDVLIDALRRLDPARFRLRLAGFGPDEAALRARAAGMSNVEFVGKITDIAGFIATTDVIVVPSRWEAFGQVAQEARLAGRPVVTSTVDGLPEQVGAAGLVADCRCPRKLAAELARLPGLPLGAMAVAARASGANAGANHLIGWALLFNAIIAGRETDTPAARSAAGFPIGTLRHG